MGVLVIRVNQRSGHDILQILEVLRQLVAYDGQEAEGPFVRIALLPRNIDERIGEKEGRRAENGD